MEEDPKTRRVTMTIEELAYYNMFMVEALFGARSPDHVDGWIRAATLELTHADLAEIASAIERAQAGGGPPRPGTRDAHA